MIDVIFLAAGEGKRAKLGFPKQYAMLGGKPMMVHGLELLQGMEEISRIIIPCRDIQFVKKVIKDFNIKKAIYVEGGETRQNSVWNGLQQTTTSQVLIMEAVRPFVTMKLIREVMDVKATVVTPWITGKASTLGSSKRFFNRNEIGQVQMPQKFQTQTLINAHALARKEYTDDSMLVWCEMGKFPVIIEGEEINIKITTPLDLIIAEAIFKSKYRSEEE